MNKWAILLIAGTCAGTTAEEYPTPPEANRADGVPRGKLTQHVFKDSDIFPGTERDYWVYVPAQYTETEPACLMVFQDGHAYINPKRGTRAPTVFDNLIHAGEMPVTIGLFVNPGVIPAANQHAQPRFNRSYEYDGMGDRYARFLIQELIPRVGASYRISDQPNDRGIGGASSGAICAFNVAWNRPDAFRRVFSTIGTFVGLRGGDEIHTLIRKTEPKPLRIFLQDGKNDLNIYGGDWWMANQTMLRALEWSGYEVRHVWGEEGHNRKQEAAIFPEAMRWLWKDWPKAVQTHPENSQNKLNQFMVEGEDWEKVSEGYGFTEGPAVNAAGELYFSDIPNSRIHKIDAAGEVSVFAEDTGKANGLMFGPDGRLYTCAGGKQQVISYDPAGGNPQVHAEGMSSNDLSIRRDGTIFFTDPRGKKVWMIPPGGDARVVDGNMPGCNGVVLNADQTLLFVTEFPGRMVSSYQVQPDGALRYKQSYYHLHLPPREGKGYLDGLTVDRDGWLYVATKLGVQICDQPGRVNAIIPMPVGVHHPSNLVFGGADFKTLYATCGEAVYKRKTRMTGAISWKAPAKPPRPRL